MSAFLAELIDGLKTLFPNRRNQSLKDKRARVRVGCHYLVELDADGRTHRSIVTDLGARGLRLKFVPKLAQGSLVTVRLEGDQGRAVTCRTAWCRRRKHSDDRIAGLEFEDPDLKNSWVGILLAELGLTDDDRPQSREWLRIDARLSVELDGLRGSVRDLGVGGGCFAFAKEPKPGLGVVCLGPWGSFPALYLTATVRHVGRDTDTGGWTTRVEFEELTPRQTRDLGRYLFRMLREAHV